MKKPTLKKVFETLTRTPTTYTLLFHEDKNLVEIADVFYSLRLAMAGSTLICKDFAVMMGRPVSIKINYKTPTGTDSTLRAFCLQNNRPRHVSC